MRSCLHESQLRLLIDLNQRPKVKKQVGRLYTYPPKRYTYQKSTSTYRSGAHLIPLFIYFDRVNAY